MRLSRTDIVPAPKVAHWCAFVAVTGALLLALAAGAVAMSDRLLHVLRLSAWQLALAWKPAEVVWCGDSLLAELPVDLARQPGWGPASSLVLAVPGARARQVIAQIELALTLPTRRVVLMAGSNDVLQSDDQLPLAWPLLLAAGQEAAGQLRAVGLPAPQLHVLAMPLRANAEHDPTIQRANRLLQALAAHYGWNYIDANPGVFTPELPRAAVLRDAVHFSVEGYQRWLANVMAAMAAAEAVQRPATATSRP